MKTYDNDGQKWAAEVGHVYRRYVWLPNQQSHDALTFFVMASHLRAPDGQFLPYYSARQYLGSTVPGCGKTLTTEVTVTMCFNGEMVLDPTYPSLVCLLSDDRATIGIDEVDVYFGSRGTTHQQTRGLINAGYRRGAKVSRQIGGQADRATIHGPMIINGKNANTFMHHPNYATLRSRSICVLLKPAPPTANIRRYNPELHEQELINLRESLRQWGIAAAPDILARPIEDVLPAELRNSRAEELWTTYFRLADYLGGEWPARCLAAARAFELGDWGDATPSVSPAEELVTAVAELFGEREDFLPTVEIINRLRQLKAKPGLMAQWNTPRAAQMGLADAMAVFEVKATRIRHGGDAERGYTRESLGLDPVPTEVQTEQAA